QFGAGCANPISVFLARSTLMAGTIGLKRNLPHSSRVAACAPNRKKLAGQPASFAPFIHLEDKSMTIHTQAPSGVQAVGDVHRVCKTQTLEMNPPGGLERLAASGVLLAEKHIEAIRSSQRARVDPGIPVTYAWPTAIEPMRAGETHITAITKCSLCK